MFDDKKLLKKFEIVSTKYYSSKAYFTIGLWVPISLTGKVSDS